MVHEGGGWTLFAYHADGVAQKIVQETLTPNTYGVMSSDKWVALRSAANIGYMFIDENQKISTISKVKTESSSCLNPSQVNDLSASINTVAFFSLFHDETSGCTIAGQDYSLATISDSKYVYYTSCGAGLYQQSALKFDKWPYVNSGYSCNEQNSLLYFLK